MFTRLPSEQEAAAAGFAVEDYAEEAEVWPENWLAIQIISQLGTQWRTGFNGPTGLDYPTLFQLLDRYELDKAEWWQMFEDLRLLEGAALKAMAG